MNNIMFIYDDKYDIGNFCFNKFYHFQLNAGLYSYWPLQNVSLVGC